MLLRSGFRAEEVDGAVERGGKNRHQDHLGAVGLRRLDQMPVPVAVDLGGPCPPTAEETVHRADHDRGVGDRSAHLVGSAYVGDGQLDLVAEDRPGLRGIPNENANGLPGPGQQGGDVSTEQPAAAGDDDHRVTAERIWCWTASATEVTVSSTGSR
jgi:hypothetical protein